MGKEHDHRLGGRDWGENDLLKWNYIRTKWEIGFERKLNNHRTFRKLVSGAEFWSFKQWGYFLKETDMINTEVKKVDMVFV